MINQSTDNQQFIKLVLLLCTVSFLGLFLLAIVKFVDYQPQAKVLGEDTSALYQHCLSNP